MQAVAINGKLALVEREALSALHEAAMSACTMIEWSDFANPETSEVHKVAFRLIEEIERLAKK